MAAKSHHGAAVSPPRETCARATATSMQVVGGVRAGEFSRRLSAERTPVVPLSWELLALPEAIITYILCWPDAATLARAAKASKSLRSVVRRGRNDDDFLAAHARRLGVPIAVLKNNLYTQGRPGLLARMRELEDGLVLAGRITDIPREFWLLLSGQVHPIVLVAHLRTIVDLIRSPAVANAQKRMAIACVERILPGTGYNWLVQFADELAQSLPFLPSTSVERYGNVETSGPRQAVLLALGRLPPAKIQRHATHIAAQLADEETSVVASAAQTLYKLEPEHLATHLDALLGLMDVPDPEVHRVGLLALGKLMAAGLAPPSVRDVFGARLQDEDPLVQAIAEQLLAAH